MMKKWYVCVPIVLVGSFAIWVCHLATSHSYQCEVCLHDNSEESWEYMRKMQEWCNERNKSVVQRFIENLWNRKNKKFDDDFDLI